MDEHAFCSRNGQMALKEIAAAPKNEHSLQNLNLVVVLLAVSMYKLGSAHDLSGLYAWCKDKMAKKFRWIASLVAFVKGHYEEGLKSMKSFLPQILNDFANDPYVLGVFQREIFQGHCAVFDSKGYQTMMESYRSAAGSGLPESEPYTAKYIDALNKFALNGVVPPTYKYDAENNPFLLDSSQQKRTGLPTTPTRKPFNSSSCNFPFEVF